MAIPDDNSIKRFNELAESVVPRLKANAEEIHTLTALRDTLLPKLMSGEVRVRETSNKQPRVAREIVAKTADKHDTPQEFIEAIVISYLVKRLGTVEYPLGRKRYNKIAYLAHRKREDDVRRRYLKKAAGPYSPWARYQGPEGIALKNGYIQTAKRNVFSGFVASSKIADIESYVDRYGLRASLDWAIETFGRRKNDTLELLATVDFAALDLIDTSRAIDLENIRNVIATNTEWAPKLDRTVFSDANIQWALDELKALFPGWYAGDT
jgi:type I restriction enzyme S subunit